MTLSIHPLAAGDLATWLDLIDGLADYEKLARPDADARLRLAADATRDPPRFRVLLAEIDGTPVGYAMYFFTYSSFLARPTLYLEDIFVLPDSRGNGAGIGLFKAVAQQAVIEGCGRMEWQVLDWNEPSIKFYERLGARHMQAWLPFRLDGAALADVGAATPAG